MRLEVSCGGGYRARPVDVGIEETGDGKGRIRGLQVLIERNNDRHVLCGKGFPMQWPDWWEWETEFSSHCLKRMSERGFTETDLRAMLDDAVQLQEQTHGTFLVVTTLANRPWEVIVSPDEDHQLLVVVTAYPC